MNKNKQSSKKGSQQAKQQNRSQSHKRSTPKRPVKAASSKPLNAPKASPNQIQKKREGHFKLLKHDSYMIFGRNAIKAALENPKRKSYRLCYLEKYHQQAQDLASLRPDIPFICIDDPDIFNHHVPSDSPHQGVLLEVSPLPQLSVHDIIGQSNALFLILDQVTDPQNVGACLRAGAGLGATALITPDRHCPHENGTIARIAAGGLEKLPWVRIGNLAATIKDLQQNGFWVIGLDGETETPLTDMPKSPKIALIMGNEGKGMRPLTKKMCDTIVKIPMTGAVESLNVATAAAIAVYEAKKATA